MEAEKCDSPIVKTHPPIFKEVPPPRSATPAGQFLTARSHPPGASAPRSFRTTSSTLGDGESSSESSGSAPSVESVLMGLRSSMKNPFHHLTLSPLEVRRSPPALFPPPKAPDGLPEFILRQTGSRSPWLP